MEVAAQSVARIHIFSQLPDCALKDIAGRCRSELFAPRSEVIGFRDPPTSVFMLVSGTARATVFSPRGKEVAFRDLRPGDVFGELSAIDGEPRSASVVATSEAVMLSMPVAQFRTVYRTYPDVADALLKTLSASVRALSSRVFEFSTLSAPDRVLVELLRLAEADDAVLHDDGSVDIVAPPTHEDLAKLINTQRETVTKELSRARREGLLGEAQGHGWKIMSLERLKARCQGN